MKMLILVALILAPNLSSAQTDCRAVEFADHMEAQCTGDEKATPVTETASPPSYQRTEVIQKAVPEQIQSSVPTEAAQPTQAHTAAAPSIAAPAQQSQNTVGQRQGRQQYKNGMDEARAARLRLIDSLQQSEPAQ